MDPEEPPSAVSGRPADGQEMVAAWQHLVDSMPQLVWVADAAGTVWFYNERVHDYDGIARTGDGSWEWQPMVHEDDAAATETAWRTALETITPYSCEHRIRMADGTYRWHVSRARPVRSDGGSLTWFGTATDIHDRALAEQRTRRSERRLSQVLDGLFTFVGLCAPDGTLQEANETALAAGGVDRSEVVGTPLWETVWWSHDPEVQAGVQRAVARAAAGKASRYDVAVRVAGGGLITIDFQLVPLFEEGEVIALVPSGSDITERIAERQRLEGLAAVAHELNGATGSAEVAALIVRHAPSVVGATFGLVGLVDEHRLSMRLTMPPLDEDQALRWVTTPLEGVRTPFHDALETGHAVYVDPELRAARYPSMIQEAAQAGLVTTAALPLVGSSGEIFGAVGFGWPERVDIDAPLRAWLRLLADLCSQALERSQRSDMHDRLVHELQSRVLAEHESLGSLDVAVGYVPAQDAIGFGGDWYDVVRIDDRHKAFVVGDVAGHGIDAAAQMATTKATVRAMILAAPSPADVLPLASRAVGHLHTGYVATVAAAWIDLDRERLEWRLAGHPPPVLRVPGAPAKLLEGAHHPPLGMPTEPKAGTTEPFPPGAMLVLYTDGLIERPGTDLDVSLELLRARVDALAADADAGTVRDALMGELLADATADDVAIVVIVRPAT